MTTPTVRLSQATKVSLSTLMLNDPAEQAFQRHFPTEGSPPLRPEMPTPEQVQTAFDNLNVADVGRAPTYKSPPATQPGPRTHGYPVQSMSASSRDVPGAQPDFGQMHTASVVRKKSPAQMTRPQPDRPVQNKPTQRVAVAHVRLFMQE